MQYRNHPEQALSCADRETSRKCGAHKQNRERQRETVNEQESHGRSKRIRRDASERRRPSNMLLELTIYFLGGCCGVGIGWFLKTEHYRNRELRERKAGGAAILRQHHALSVRVLRPVLRHHSTRI
jgi:hypothetical protein